MSLLYTHQELSDPRGQIRLLRILPDSPSSPISCVLEVVQRKEEPKYVAVSYTWGELTPVDNILVNGKPLIVRRNCFFALWQLRLHNVNLPIWIDSICIDQSNNHEKSSQVRMMGSIYARAELTAACIGDGTQLYAVAQDIENDPDPSGTFRNKWNLGNLDQLFDVWRDLYALASGQYFKRLWIVQELYHSKEVALFCGEDILLWRDLEPFFLEIAEAVSVLTSHLEDVPEDLVDLEETELARFIHFRKFRMAQIAVKAEWTDEITGHGFTGVLLSFGEGKCVDPRDKIYGLLSLAQDRRWLVNFPVDYNRPLTDVLRDVVTRIGSESLTENCSRLIANMLRWFRIEPASIQGQSLLGTPGSDITGPLVPWSNFRENVVSFESVRVWKVSSVPMTARTKWPHSNNAVLVLQGDSSEEGSTIQNAPFNWHEVCFARGKLIQSHSETFWIAGPEVKPADFIVQFQAMRDEQDEYNTTIVCRPIDRKSTRMEIVDQATGFVDLEEYDALYETNLQRSWPPERLLRPERQYLRSRMLFARPCDDRMTVYLRPFDLINLTMLRGHVIERIRFPILSKSSGCYVIKDEVDNAELASRTKTATVTLEEVEEARRQRELAEELLREARRQQALLNELQDEYEHAHI